jgi:hypothetical protein
VRLNYWKESWPLSEADCPCDLHFLEYLAGKGLTRKTIFHFGSGEHHVLGVRNAKRPEEERHEILAVTASPQEHAAYVELVTGRADIAVHYKVMFADIYTLAPRLLPSFDLVTLFHLCEFYDPVRSRYAPLDDASLLRMFIGKLSRGGRVAFYTGSSHFHLARPIIDRAVRRGWLAPADRHKTLEFYKAGRRA